MSVSEILSAMQPVMAPQPMSDGDGVNLLIMMSDDPVRQKVGEAFTLQMQNSGRVRGTFFSGAGALIAPLPSDLNDWAGQVASALIALALAQCSSHGFNATVNSGQAQAFVNNSLTASNPNFTRLGMQNYQTLFPAYCTANGVSFGAFLGGTYGPAQHWGTVLADHLTDPAYINQEMIKLNPGVDPSGWYQIFYANIYKVQCLNGSEVERVLTTWDPYLKGKEKPGTGLPWTVWDHMVASSYNLYTFMGQVQSAINVSHSETETLGCQGGPAAHCTTETTTTYGGQVNDWLSNNRGLGGFINGPSSSNVESHTDGGGGCGCFVPGTPVLLADGTSKPIEAVAAGDAVISREGQVHTRSPQDVCWQAEPHELLFGINEYPPFFNASHPFMTTEGWKSMSPKASRRINPDIEVTQLKAGDILLQAEPGTPLRYRQVKVHIITRMLAKDAPTRNIHSLHLTRVNPGYHAHGFLVAVNYPELREDHFVLAFKGITEAERVYLRSHFEALAPFLRRGLGNYVSEILRRALGAPGEETPIGAPVTHTVTHADAVKV